MLNSVVKISMMSAKYFEYYTIILRGAVFSWTQCTVITQNTYLHKNESKHSEMGPVRQNPIQRTVRSVHMCVHCTVLHTAHTILHRTDLIIFPLTLHWPPDNHHCSDDVYLREGSG